MAQTLMDLQLQKKFSRERDCISGKQREQENYPPEVQHKMMEKRSMKAKKTSSRRCDDARERNKTGVYHLPILEVSALFSAKRWSMRRTVRWLKGLSWLDSIHFSSVASIVPFRFMSALLNSVTISGSVSGGNNGRCGGGYICGGRADPLPNGDCP